MKYTLSMTFLTAASKRSTLSISGIKSNPTKDEVNTLMDIASAKNIFNTSSGNLTAKSGAQLPQRQVTKYEVS